MNNCDQLYSIYIWKINTGQQVMDDHLWQNITLNNISGDS